MMITPQDKDALYALIVRFVRAQDERNGAQKMFEEARIKLAETQKTIANITTAFSVFGYTLEGEKPWDPIKEAVGEKKWAHALLAARGNADQQDSDNESDDDSSTEENYEELDNTEQDIPHNIKRIVLDRLSAAGANGTKIAPIKEFISKLGIEMHDKTVGMTLYRLSKDGLARREGRTWFYVAPKEETENPGAGGAGAD
jgi:hypothetical protein